MKFPHLRPPYCFGGVESTFNQSKAVLVQVPYDSTVSYGIGARYGPHAIITASRDLELYDLELKKETIEEIPVYTMDEMEPNMNSPEKTIERVEKAVEEIIENNKFPIVVGGEHSISLGPVKALKKKYKNLSVLQIDAHPDLREEYEGSKYNHACVMRRIKDEGIGIVQVGIRSVCKTDFEYMKKEKIETHYGNKFDIDRILEKLSDEVYITVDLDCFDPSIMPAVGTPEPGGLSWEQVLEITKRVGKEKKVVGFDVVELAPIHGETRSDFLAAKLIYKLLGYSFR